MLIYARDDHDKTTSHRLYYLTIRRAKNSKWQREWENNTVIMYNIVHTRLTHRHLMLRNTQQPTCGNTAHRNQSLTIKHCLQDCPNGETAERNTISMVTYGHYYERIVK